MLTAMARSTIKFLKQQGQFNPRIAALVGCDRHTVTRVLEEPGDGPRRHRAARRRWWWFRRIVIAHSDAS